MAHAEPAASVQTHIQGPAKSGGRQGAQSGPQGMLSAEPSMRDQDGEMPIQVHLPCYGSFLPLLYTMNPHLLWFCLTL